MNPAHHSPPRKPRQASSTDDRLPQWLWQILRALFATMLMGIAAIVAVIALGFTIPRPYGLLRVADYLDSTSGWIVDPENSVVPSPSQGGLHLSLADPFQFATAMSPYLIQPSATVEVSLQQQGGPMEAAFGLWWGDGTDAYCAIGINGNSYYAIYCTSEGATDYSINWQRFPHILPQGESNRLRIDYTSQGVSVRINDELAGDIAGNYPDLVHVGVFVETGTRGGTDVRIDWLKIWQELPN